LSRHKRLALLFESEGLKKESMSGFIVAGTSSGSGKTTITLGIMSYLSHQGIRVQGFKVGPDFIDPSHHEKITGLPSHNLDTWMLRPWYNTSLFQQYDKGAHISIIEGVMGLYDGFSPTSEEGSTAHLAKILRLPVILVVDASSVARSICATIMGFIRFDPQVNITGVILNRVASISHGDLLKRSIEHYLNIRCFGIFQKEPAIGIPSRHLGLHMGEEDIWDGEKVSSLLRWTQDSLTREFHIFCDTLISRAQTPTTPLPYPTTKKGHRGVKVAVARDRAFCFYYHENIRLLQSQGAEIIYFSPLQDEMLPPDIGAIYLGGGYPELYASHLSTNISLIRAIREFAEKGGIIYGECGGFMYLMSSITTLEGERFPMTGIFPLHATMQERLSSLGYREVKFIQSTPLGPPGLCIRGHEFHYSNVREMEKYPQQAYRTRMRRGKEVPHGGILYKNVLGSYIHLHFGSNILTARYLVHNAKIFTREIQLC